MLTKLLTTLAIAATSVNAVGVVNTDAGQIQGYTSGPVDIWRGIPFAAPPTGDNRFKRPQPVTPWTGVKETVIQAEICPQVRLTDFLFLGKEDCLYLDVYSPTERSDPLPVFVWFFGGGWVFGDGWEFGFYDGANLAKSRDMIVVTLNYRLGPLGFMSLDEFTAEDADGLSGNQALLDQRQALQWVQKNIAKFGGDPNRVTIAGESAGAFSVCWHLGSPGSAGLFHAAILESGTCEAREFFLDVESSKSWSKGYSSIVGCDPSQLKDDALVKCLRDLPTGHIMGHLLGNTHKLTGEGYTNRTGVLGNTTYTMSAMQQEWVSNMHALKSNFPADTFQPLLYPVMSWSATIDGKDQGLPRMPIESMRNGTFNRVPVIMGTNENEGNIFVPLLAFAIPGISLPLTQKDLTTAFDHFFNANGTVVNQILDEYPLYNYANPEQDAAMIVRDYFFACAARNTLQVLQKQGIPVWLYHFTYPGDFIESPILGDYHSAELPFVFDNPWPPILHIFSKNDQLMANSFNEYWSNLVHFHDPNGNGINPPAVHWPAYNSTTLQNIIMDVPVHVENDLVKDKCEFWTAVNANYPWKAQFTATY